MAPKLLYIGGRLLCRLLLPRLRVIPSMPTRTLGHLIPPNQYDVALSKKFHLRYVLRHHWELIPVFLTSLTSLGILAFAIVFSIRNKVDVVYKTHSRDSISRTMNLCHPTVHKLIVPTTYEPWPAMQHLLEKCKEAEEGGPHIKGSVRKFTC